MKKVSIIVILILALIALYIWWPRNSADTIPSSGVTDTTSTSTTMSVEDYVRSNISNLSPEPAVLGGTYYVTNIDVGNGTGTVEYEDGHVAHTADFTYKTDQNGPSITTFELKN